MRDTILNKKFKFVYWNAVQILVALNIIFFILTNLLKVQIGGVNLVYWMSLIPVFVNHGYIWQFVTYMFVHVDPMHIIFNMYALLVFGSNLERVIGSREFLCYYFVCGILGGVISYLINMFTGLQMVAILGASGAIYALMFLSSILYPDSRVILFFLIPMRMPVAVLVFITLEVLSQVFGSASGIAHLVHLSSIAVGWIYCLIRFKISPVKVWKSVLK